MVWCMTPDEPADRLADHLAHIDRQRASRVGGVSPNQPRTPMRSFRVSDEVWEAAQAKAADEGRTVSEVLRELLEQYAEGEKGS